jgi:hypothetical protein
VAQGGWLVGDQAGASYAKDAISGTLLEEMNTHLGHSLSLGQTCSPCKIWCPCHPGLSHLASQTPLCPTFTALHRTSFLLECFHACA